MKPIRSWFVADTDGWSKWWFVLHTEQEQAWIDALAECWSDRAAVESTQCIPWHCDQDGRVISVLLTVAGLQFDRVWKLLGDS